MRMTGTIEMHITTEITVTVTGQSRADGVWHGVTHVDGVSHGRWHRHPDGTVALTGGPSARSDSLSRAIQSAVALHMAAQSL